MTLVPAVLRHLHWSFPQFFCILLSLRKLLFFFTVHPRLYFSDLKLRTLFCPFIFSFYLVLKDDRTFRFPFYPHDLRHGWSSSELTFIFLLFFFGFVTSRGVCSVNAVGGEESSTWPKRAPLPGERVKVLVLHPHTIETDWKKKSSVKHIHSRRQPLPVLLPLLSFPKVTNVHSSGTSLRECRSSE